MNKIMVVSILSFSLIFTGCVVAERESSEDNTKQYIDKINELEETQELLEGEIAVLEQAVVEAEKPVEEDITMIEAVVEPQKRLSMTELEAFNHDIDGDGLIEKVMIYTNAVKDEQGRMMWDDGHQFLVLLEDGESFYTLFDEYVQLGRVYFSVYTGTEDSNPGILTLVSTYDGLRLVNHEFLPEGGIGSAINYPTGNMNVIFSSIPWD